MNSSSSSFASYSACFNKPSLWMMWAWPANQFLCFLLGISFSLSNDISLIIWSLTSDRGSYLWSACDSISANLLSIVSLTLYSLVGKSSWIECLRKSLPVTGSIVFLCISSKSSKKEPRGILSVGLIRPTWAIKFKSLTFLMVLAIFFWTLDRSLV